MNPLASLEPRHLSICEQIGGDDAVTMSPQVVTPSPYAPITSWPGRFRRIAVQGDSSATEAVGASPTRTYHIEKYEGGKTTRMTRQAEGEWRETAPNERATQRRWIARGGSTLMHETRARGQSEGEDTAERLRAALHHRRRQNVSPFFTFNRSRRGHSVGGFIACLKRMEPDLSSPCCARCDGLARAKLPPSLHPPSPPGTNVKGGATATSSTSNLPSIFLSISGPLSDCLCRVLLRFFPTVSGTLSVCAVATKPLTSRHIPLSDAIATGCRTLQSLPLNGAREICATPNGCASFAWDR